MGLMPSEFIAASSESWTGDYATDKEVAETFEAADLVAYANTIAFNLTFGSSYSNSSGLPGGEESEYWWDWDPGDYPPNREAFK